MFLKRDNEIDPMSVETIHNFFDEISKKYPNNIAIKCENISLTYEELGHKSNKLAHKLRDLGVKKGEIVGVMLPRCPEVIIAQLAILKAGGAYLCIDPELPVARIDYMLDETKIKILISEEKISQYINFFNIIVNPFNEANYSQKSNNLENINTPNDLAYIIYTSGSTGIPKGVLVAHRGIPNHVLHYTKELNLSHEDNIAQFASYSFDASVSEIMLALLNGATLHIVPKDIINNFRNFENFLNQNKITAITLPPPYLININPGNIQFLRVLITAGSPTNHAIVNLWKEKVLYMNAYGPSETTICSTTYVCDKKTNSYKTIPIGKPISNFSAYLLLDNHLVILEDAPIGVSGELCVSGIGISDGYINSHALTTEKFISIPALSNHKIYKTGDMVEKNADGFLEFLGRVDEQIKVRGYRVELGEIKEVLERNSAIKDSYLLPKIDPKGNTNIFAYLVTDEKIDVKNIKRELSKQLPSYMIPSNFICLNVLPLNVNGKVDKEKLPLPTTEIKNFTQENPSTQLERDLLDILKNILFTNDLGVNENFFDLGMDSLKGIELISEMSARLGLEVDISDIFKYQTIKNIAFYLNKRSKQEDFYENVKITKSERKTYHNLSSAQERLYFIYKLFPDSIAYNEQAAFLIEGDLCKEDISKIESVFKELIWRHESLRTSFNLTKDTPQQIINENFEFRVENTSVENYISSYCSNSQKKIKDVVRKFLRPFDLSVAPLFRVGVFSLSTDKHLFILDIHHIIIDGISINILLEEFIKLYMGEKLVPLSVDYIDYSEWLKAYLMSGKIKKAENYWLEQYKNNTSVLNLPIDYQRKSEKTFNGSVIYQKLDLEIVNQINSISRENFVSQYTILLAAFYILLYQYSSQEDIIIGCPVANRPIKELSKIIGMFVNTLPIRAYVSGDMTFDEFLVDIKEKIFSALKYQDYPLDDLIKNLNIERDLSRNPLFDVLFVMQNEWMPEISLDNLKFEKFEIEKTTAFFDLMLEVESKKYDLTLKFNYDASLFRKKTADRILSHYVTILTQIIKPESKFKKICELEVLSSIDKNEILFEWNKTYAKFKSENTIHEFFEKRVEETPKKNAIIFNDKKLTYEELNKKSNQLGKYLIGIGAKTETLIAIVMDRSIDLMVSILGILKAGCAYVPIDPTLPKERVDFILNDANIEFIITNKKYKELIGHQHEKYIVFLDDDYKKILLEKDGNLNGQARSGNLAYVIYTSGSTGEPKGVLTEHSGALNTLLTMDKCYPVLEDDVYILKTNYVFDVSITELFGWFIGKGSLLILEPNKEKDCLFLLNKMKKHEVTHINFVPSMLSVFLKQIQENQRTSFLKYIFVAGEPFPLQLASLAQFIFGKSVYIVNLYGPTEASIYATNFVFHKGIKKMLIGKPLLNVKIYILNQELQPVPIGVSGELYIAGKGIARGYLNRPILTKERFINSPFVNGEKIYKTGDLVRYLEDGNIEFIGRIDFQVKLRGFRIETSEIESVLRQEKNIGDVVVLLREDEENMKYLAAYISLKSKLNSERENEFSRKLKVFLAQKLPIYMVPDAWVYLDEFPLTQSGKIDRLALPKPHSIGLLSEEYASPTNDLEERIAKIWREVLNIKRIGIYDDFFDLGGNSLKVIEVHSKMLREFDIEMNDIYVSKTIQKLAQRAIYRENNLTKKLNSINALIVRNQKSELKEILSNQIENYRKDASNKFNKINLSNKRKYENILLTGGTGFLGIYLLKELLDKTEAKIYIFIRNDTLQAAEKRLSEKSFFYFGEDYLLRYSHRIKILLGDLVKERLGLPIEIYNELTLTIDCILNSAACVKHYAPYDELYAHNVTSVEHLIEFSLLGIKKNFHHISTISTGYSLLPDDRHHVIFHEDKKLILDEVDNYYVHTKAISEKLIQDAREKKGLVANIYRLGNVIFCSKTGVMQENISDNAFFRIMKSFLELGYIPNTDAINFDFSYVDHLSKAIVLLFDNVVLDNEDYNLENPYKISLQKLSELLVLAGCKIKAIDNSEYLDYIVNNCNLEDKRFYISSLLTHLYNHKLHEKNIIFLNDKTNLILNNFGFLWESINVSKIQMLLHNCHKVNIS